MNRKDRRKHEATVSRKCNHDFLHNGESLFICTKCQTIAHHGDFGKYSFRIELDEPVK